MNRTGAVAWDDQSDPDPLDKARPAGRDSGRAPSLQDVLRWLEGPAEVARHLQVSLEKPCVAAFFTGAVTPEVGQRSRTAYALAAELRRVGTSGEQALAHMGRWWAKLPADIREAPGRDGQGFRQREVETATRAAYRSEAVKSSGCHSSVWKGACTDQDHCPFYREITGNRRQSRTAAFDSFLLWIPARDSRGKKILSEGDIRIYLALCRVERKRDCPPGARLYVGWRELAAEACLERSKLGGMLQRLWHHGLITYVPGGGRRQGASEIRRVLPVPRPP